MYCYYLSFNARYPPAWASEANLDEGSWKCLERKIISNTKLIKPASLWYSVKPPAALNNSIIKFSCSIAKMLHRRLGINGLMLPPCPIWSNTSLTAGGNPLNNKLWQQKGILSTGQILNANGLCTFSDMKI